MVEGRQTVLANFITKIPHRNWILTQRARDKRLRLLDTQEVNQWAEASFLRALHLPRNTVGTIWLD